MVQSFRWTLSAYGWVTRCLTPFVLMRAWWNGRKSPLYRSNLLQRVGWSYPTESIGSSIIWLHAVSLGETRAAATLIRRLQEQYPESQLLLTHFTATGMAEGAKYLRKTDLQIWAPWDSPGVVRRFLRRFRPRVALLMETEVWPTWMREMKRLGTPVLLVNGRLSERSMQKALRLSAISRQTFASFTRVMSQSIADGERFKALGVPSVSVTGNLKFEMNRNEALLNRGREWRGRLNKPVVIFASSREGEEAMWLNEWRQLKSSGLSAQAHWLLVPRHPERFQEVQALLSASGLTASLRSSWGEQGPSVEDQSTDVWIGDSLGEMHLYFGLSDAALMGGSFGPYGSQNFIEAVACECPVVVGPSTYNFADAARLLQEAGCFTQVNHMEDAMVVALRWLQQPAVLEALRVAGAAEVRRQSGATQRTWELIAPYLGTRHQAPESSR